MAEEKAAYSTIAEIPNGIVLAKYEKTERVEESYQTEAQLEEKFVNDLVSQGYERYSGHTSEDLLNNLRIQLEALNKINFTDNEWERFKKEYLLRENDTVVDCTRRIQEDHIFDFKFDDGTLKNIMLLDKKNIYNNKLQVVNQVTQKEHFKNRYDVTVLVNGLPLVHIELKARGVGMAEAFSQIQRYGRETFNGENSLYKYVQIFVISNGTFSRYFANTTERNKNNFEFTCEWADAKNNAIRDLEDFTATFFNKQTILYMLTRYCIFDSNNILMIMRPYQIAATERILWRIKSSYQNKKFGTTEAGGYIWHTTGSGKTLTSFKTARLATELEFIDKVFFVVDRKDLDYQTMKEYQRFQKNSVNGSKNTKELKESIEKRDDRIVVTTIQKLNEFVKKNPAHPVYDKHCVLIFDECHRSQFGKAQTAIKRKFKKYYQFGFTGTPIFPENSLTEKTTADVFGRQLHSYVITDAIRDEKVLKFKVDYLNVNVDYKVCEEATALLDDAEDIIKEELHNPDRIKAVAEYILRVYNTKTHRNQHYYNVKDRRLNGFNAMFAVDSVNAAKLYYQAFKDLQSNLEDEQKLKVATIFSFAPNEAKEAKGEIIDEGFTPSALDKTGKEFLDEAIQDYNEMFKSNFSLAEGDFQNYYKDLSQKVKNKEVDILIVVGMFLTGFDAPTMNTLFVDKNLRYHGLIQAFSRTNRILNSLKPFGNIVCFRPLEEATKEALRLFGDENSINVVMERCFNDYYLGYRDDDDKYHEGYVDIAKELLEKYPDPAADLTDAAKRDFVNLFGRLLKKDNILRNYDEYETADKIISPRLLQDMKSLYIELMNTLKPIKKPPINPPVGPDINPPPLVDLPPVEIVFYVEFLKTDEINLDYILELILLKYKESENMEEIKDEVRRAIRSSLDTVSKETLVMEYLNSNSLNDIIDKKSIMDSFYTYAKEVKDKKIKELIEQEKLRNDSERFIELSISRGYVDETGSELDNIIPPTSRRKGAREKKKKNIFAKISQLVEEFVGI